MAKCRCHVINKNCLNHDYVDKNKALILLTTAVTFEKVPTVTRQRKGDVNRLQTFLFVDSHVIFRL